MKRREFTKAISVALSAPIATGCSTRLINTRSSGVIKPAALKQGDTIALIAPGGFVEDAAIEKSTRNLESLGFKVRLADNLRAVRGNTGGTIAQRVSDLHTMFRDRDVKALWAVRGGSGANQLLAYIDYAIIRDHPKILIGYSDITALHLAVFKQTGLVTFHAPVASSTFSDYSVNHLRAILMSPQPSYTMHHADENNAKAAEQIQYLRRTINDGKDGSGIAQGTLIGGNLSVLTALVGTPYSADFAGALLFLEEISEAPYRIDRMLTQINQSQALDKAEAIFFGVCMKCDSPPNERSLTLQQTLDDHTRQLKTPSGYGFSFGHIAHQMTLPLGIKARVDCNNHTLTLLESAVQNA